MPGPWKAWKTKSGFPTRRRQRVHLFTTEPRERKSAATRPPHSFTPLSLRSSGNPVSCSSFDWKMLLGARLEVEISAILREFAESERTWYASIDVESLVSGQA